MQVVLMTAEHEAPTSVALLDVLRAAGLHALVATGATCADEHDARTFYAADNGVADWPHFVLLEVCDGADAGVVRAAIARAAAVWPEALLVACRRPATVQTQTHRLDAAALERLGFHAVADEPAQVPALLRELADSGAVAAEPTAHDTQFERAPDSLLLPERLPIAQLRVAFEAVAALHFVTDQRSAAQTALAGLAPLVSADRWALYLTEEARGPQVTSFELLAVRGQTESERAIAEDDWRRALAGGDSLLALSGCESRAVRAAVARVEPVRKTEDARRTLAVALTSGGRVLGVIEAVREGAQARAFTTREAALLAALAVPTSAALANSARIAEAERLSLTDDLTKLHNARFLRQYLTAEIKRARRYDSAVAALFLDLDDFKEVNDRHGHLVGSHVLMEMATVILTGVRDTDVVARYGGDEFVVVLPETNIEQAIFVAERIRATIATHAFTGGRNLSLQLTASFGVAAFPAHAQSPQQLLADADAAMYEAKAARKNCVRLAAGPDVTEHGAS
jgi:diguanylate cyclase (GGDEF)-like protein